MDFFTDGATVRPTHCPGASFTPYVNIQELNERQPRPNIQGDEEDVVLFMTVLYGGELGLRAHRPGGPLSIAVWVPPDAALHTLRGLLAIVAP